MITLSSSSELHDAKANIVISARKRYLILFIVVVVKMVNVLNRWSKIRLMALM